MAEKARDNCDDQKTVKSSTLQAAISPSHEYEAITKIDSYGGRFGTGYDSVDVYIRRVGNIGSNMLLLSIEDNADDLSSKNLKTEWPSPHRLLIHYGHGDVTFQAIKFADITITAVQDSSLDQVAH